MNEKENNEKEMPTERVGIFKIGEGTLINKDTQALIAYKARKRKMQEIDILKNEMNDLKSDIQEIKQLLKGLIK